MFELRFKGWIEGTGGEGKEGHLQQIDWHMQRPSGSNKEERTPVWSGHRG